MNRKIIMLISLMLLVGISVFVLAQPRGYEQEYATTIYKGWNLVYGFTIPDQLEGQSLDKSHIKAIYVFMPMTQEYVRFYPNLEEQKMEKIISTLGNDEFNPSITALWVYSDATVEGSLNGIPHATEYWLERQPLPYNTNPLYKGWNFVGVTRDMIPGPQDTNLKDIKGTCNIEKSYFFNADMQKWEKAPIEYAQLEENSLGSGWVIKVSNDCKLGKTGGSLVNPPQIPY